MKKKMIVSLLCIGLIVSLLTGCKGIQDKSASESSKNTEKNEEAVSDEETSKKLNKYGLTDAQQEALLEAVKTSVTEGYLEKYNIPASDFELRPFDVNDLNHYDSSNEYTGEDPYECAVLWNVMDHTVLGASLEVTLRTFMDVRDRESALDIIQEEDTHLEDTFEARNQKNREVDNVSYELDTSSQSYALWNSVYMGIVEFLNGLDEQERAEVLYDLYENAFDNSEEVVLDNGSTVRSRTMFDKVISENIEFK